MFDFIIVASSLIGPSTHLYSSFKIYLRTGNLPSKRTRFSGPDCRVWEFYRLCGVSRTNNYTFFYPASMVWRSKIKIGCPNFAVKVEFVQKRTPQNVNYSCHASKKSKPRTIDLFSSLLFVLCKKGSQLVKNVNSCPL